MHPLPHSPGSIAFGEEPRSLHPELSESHQLYKIFVNLVGLLLVNLLLLPFDSNWLGYTHIGLQFNEGDCIQSSGVAVEEVN